MRVKASDSLSEITLLYVEDDETIREVLTQILRRYVKRLYVAENGQRGVELFKEYSPEIVLSDIRMPKMDGIDMARKIKDIKPKTAIVFTTAFSESEYLKSAIELGAEGYLIKPIDRDRLVEKLNYIADAIVNERRKDAYFKLLVRLFDNQSEAMVLADESGRVVLSNLAYKKFCLSVGCNELENINAIVPCIKKSKDCIGESFSTQGELSELFEDEKERLTLCFDADGKMRYYEFNLKKVDEYTLYEFKDITSLKREAKVLALESYTDALTGLYNRKYEERLKEEVIGLKEEACFLFCDIDHFKRINDTCGHMVGDIVIRRVAEQLRSHLRSDDIAVRWGGEEFLVVLKTGLKKAEVVAEKIRRVVEQMRVDPVERITISIGVKCGVIESEDDFYEVLNEADEALYMAKEAGRNRVKVYGR